jgi:hypothetical protein
MAEMHSQERAYLRSFSTLDIHQVGDILESGSEHRVRILRPASVLKIPRERIETRTTLQRLFRPPMTASRQREQLAAVREHFENYVVEITVLENPRDGYCLVQPHLEFDRITLDDLQEESDMHDQLQEFAALHRVLVEKRGRFLDVLGAPNAGKAHEPPYINNIVIEKPSRALKILDPYLHLLPGLSPKSWYARKLWNMSRAYLVKLGLKLQ